MKTETVTYAADGLTMKGELYWDETKAGPRPGVLVFPEAFGLGEHAKSRARRLAEHGYVALAGDLHGDGKVFTSLPDIMPTIMALRDEPARIRARAKGALDVLAARPEVDAARIASIGFCFGGTMSLELARSGADIVAVTGFHSGLETKAPAEDAKAIKAKILVCIGADDPGIPLEQRAAFEQEMKGGGVDWRLHVYGRVVHSFTNPDADKVGMPDFARYDGSADRRSWGEMLALFDEAFA
ncbi:dienelactone hydrolase family protein [Flavisphingomonas formosensis]|uniref:dienelactone hydrolase family protein n=1 Tax=Flavisphingomonas formosensis TaxID=861534 RepID=UPI0012F761DB|nr:dienelactone hydrolase family protein [Sphingomonas formosensis]